MEENDPFASIETFREGLRRRFPDIRAYGEDDWDWTWADEGMEFMEAGDFGMAELKFQQLIVAQPDHPDGYECLALLYGRLGHRREALVLIAEAVRIARQHVEKGLIDQEVLDEILAEQSDIATG